MEKSQPRYGGNSCLWVGHKKRSESLIQCFITMKCFQLLHSGWENREESIFFLSGLQQAGLGVQESNGVSTGNRWYSGGEALRMLSHGRRVEDIQ